MDINEKVLMAFQVEYPDHLEGIRTVLSENGTLVDEYSINEAFRMAHSLKGGARVCGLPPIEKLAHRLESLFGHIRDHEVGWCDYVQDAVHLVLDSIEDWMTALARGEQPADPQESIDTLDRLMEQVSPSEKKTSSTDNLQDKLLVAFDQEHKSYLVTLRQVAQSALSGENIDADQIQEAYRCAHSLKGAARAVGLSEVESQGRQLESLLHHIHDGVVELEDAAASKIVDLTNAIENAVKYAIDKPPSVPPATPHDQAEEKPGIEATENRDETTVAFADGQPSDRSASARMPSPGQTEQTLRIDATRLDRILDSTNELSTVCNRQISIASDIDAIGSGLSQLDKQWQSLRKTTGLDFQGLGSTSEFSRLTTFFENFEYEVRRLLKQYRCLESKHQTSFRSLQGLAGRMQAQIRDARLVSVGSIVGGMRKMLRDLAKDEGKRIDVHFSGTEAMVDRLVLQAIKDPLIHMLSNAVTHGIETPDVRSGKGKREYGHVTLEVRPSGRMIEFRIIDDGCGLDAEVIVKKAKQRGLIAEEVHPDTVTSEQLTSLVVHPGFSTAKSVSEISGRGIGMSVVQETVERLGGLLKLQTNEPTGTCITITIPVSMATQRVLIVQAGGTNFAVPISAVHSLTRVNEEHITPIEGQSTVEIDGQPTRLTAMGLLLGIDDGEIRPDNAMIPVMVLKTFNQLTAVAVDQLADERDVLVKDLHEPANRIEHFSGGVMLDDGTVALVINSSRLIPSDAEALLSPRMSTGLVAEQQHQPSVLIVDDSFTTRTLEKSILETHGYTVYVAVDGVDALSKLRTETVDLVVSDVEMPRMNGFELVEAIRSDRHLSKTPIILVTSRDRAEDRERGLSLGANAYIVKQKFDHQDLLQTVKQVA